MTEALYEVQNLKHRYGKGPLTLDIDSLKIYGGRITGLVGPNGSGKSTLLRILAFLEPWNEGTLLFEGKNAKGRERELRRTVTYLLQEPYLLKRSVFENIAYGLRLRGETNGLKEKVWDALERVGLPPESFADRSWLRLSGGEVQRVALAARLALRPNVLLLDEPTANVDRPSADLVRDAAFSACEEWGAAVIIASHDLAWLYEVTSDTVSLYRGRVAGLGPINIFDGEWRADGPCFFMDLNGGRIEGLRGDESEVSCGVVHPDDIKISAPGTEAGDNMNALDGVVTQTALERRSGGILVSVETGGVTFRARLPKGEAPCRISPASTVQLSFAKDKVRWL